MLRRALMLTVFVVPSVCSASPSQTLRSNISVTVPEVCSIEASMLTVDRDTGVVSGDVLEMCNSNRAFRLIATHRMLEAGERAQIDYAGQRSNLETAGVSDIAIRQGPVIRRFPILLRTNGLRQDLTISLGFAAI